MNVIKSAFLGAFLTSMAAGTASAQDPYNGCTFSRADGVNFPWKSYLAATSMRYSYDPQPFMYRTLCGWFPNSDFVFSGLASDGSNLRERNGLRVLDVTVNGCTFEMEFGVKGNNFELNSNRQICDRPRNASGVREIEQQVNDDVFSVFCNDGSAGTVDMDRTSGCAIFDGDVQCKSGATVAELAELICR